jgi:hypothetical protein
MAVTRPRKIESDSDERRKLGGPAFGVLTVAATAGGTRLVFADKLVEVLKEADEDDEKRAGNPHEEYPGAEGHGGEGKSDHTAIVNHARRERTRMAHMAC